MSRGRVAPAGPQPGPPADDTGATVLHVDMDAFYASVEVRRDPTLRGRPVLVGGTGNRSVVCAASYEARVYGVHSAMPMSRARRLCPTAVVIPPDFPAYSAASKAVMAVFGEVTPLVEPLSLDEAFLDVAGAVRRMGSPAVIGNWIRERVATEQQLTCSVGVATTKFVAKLASARCKPDGLLVVPANGVLDFLHPLPVAALWGVGQRTEEVLTRHGLHTVGDLARSDQATLVAALGASAGAHLHALAWGRDERSVVAHEPEKSCGAEETFAEDVGDPAVVHRELLRLAERTASRLRAGGYVGRTIAIKVRFADFTTITRSRTLPDATDLTSTVYATARALYDALALGTTPLRLVGVRVEGLVRASATSEQLAFDTAEPSRRDAELAVDRAAQRFGDGAVRPATLIRPSDRPNPSVPRPELQ
ncbi:MAG TPA: DNA polymerase IV [Mycobacteriales bacterium]|nr:DNA polymerase IV [Mycobacteriales bacterium]